MSVFARRALSVLFTCSLLLGVGVLGGASASAEVVHGFLFAFGGGETPAGAFEGDLTTAAIDQTSGDVYVAAINHDAVYRFDAAGKYLGEITGAAVPQGSLGLNGLSAIAVDNSAGPNKGDLYVAGSENGVVYRFDSLGKLLSQVSGSATPAGSFTPVGVAVDPSGNLFVVDIAGSVVDKFDPAGGYTGQIISSEIILPNKTIAVDSGDNVYLTNNELNVVKLEPGGTSSVLDTDNPKSVAVDPATNHVYVAEHVSDSVARIAEYDQSGKRLGTFGEERLGKVLGIAVQDTTGDVYTTDSANVLVDVFGPAVVIPDAVTQAASSVQPSSATLNGTVNPDGVQVTGCEFEYGTGTSYGQSIACAQSPASIGAGSSAVSVSADLGSLQPDTEYHYRVAVSNANGTNHGTDDTLVTSGPPRIDSESANAITQTTATLEGQVNPFGLDTTYRFEYGTSTSYGTSIPVPDADIGSQTTDQAVSQSIAKLSPGITYHYRIVAINAQATVDGADQTFTTVPAASIDSEYATNVASTSATINAQVNPLGSSTEYHVEYGTSTAYGYAVSGSVGEGTADVLVSYHASELAAGTTYHYRILVHNALGTIEGADQTFTTQAAGGNELALPDGRAWELVSPPNKSGALIENVELAQAAGDGSGIAYAASEPIGEGIVGHVGHNLTGNASARALSVRGPDGWSTRDISAKQTLPPEGSPPKEIFGSAEAFYLFSPDLSVGVFEPRGVVGPQSEGINERTLYLRNNKSETYQPLVSSANVPPGTRFGPTSISEEMYYVAATPNLTHVVLSTGIPLTQEAVREVLHSGELAENLYEWNAGKLQLVNILPDGTTKAGVALGSNSVAAPEGLESHTGASPYAMSSDGRWIVFHYASSGSRSTYFVRDMVEKKTVQFGQSAGSTRFETMNRDGSKVFYLESDKVESNGLNAEGELFVFDPVTGVRVDLTADHLDGEASAEVENKLVGTSEDGSFVYFVARGVLAAGASAGADNLYVLHDNGGEWATAFIATLSGEDGKDWLPTQAAAGELSVMTSRVSSDGGYLAFMSESSLTGYDNRDAVSGQPDAETYLYDADKNRLVCVSCNPSGARPVGVHELEEPVGAQELEEGAKTFLMDQGRTWGGNSAKEPWNGGRGHWLASMLPPAWYGDWSVAFYQPRSLFDSGRLFFESTDALVAQDTNGLADVYEYEPSGVGDCSAASTTFSERTGGCVGLISSGQSGSESEFFDASESGDDVFFITASKLVPEDYDSAYDVYDAHVCSMTVPCRSVPVSSPACSSGDSCKAAPSPQPAIFGTAPSATFSGIGNVIEEAKKGLVKHKPKPKAKKKTKKRVKRKAKGKRGRRAGRSRTGRTSGRAK